MKFDRETYERMTDEEKAAYLDKLEEEAFEQAKGKTFAPGSIAPEKARFQEGFEVIGHEDAEGNVHYYTEEEKQAQKDRFAGNEDEDNQK